MILNPVETMIALNQANKGNLHTFNAGSTIFREGEAGKVMYGIVTGSVDIIVNGKISETLHESDVFGIGAIVHLDHLRSSTAVAQKDCQLVTLDQEHFLFASQEAPMFALEIMKKYSDRLRFVRR